jgi:hypothetical protein
MISLLIYLIVVGIVVALAMWLIDYLPVPQPLNRWLKIAITVVAALIIIMLLLDVAGVDTGFRSGPIVQ